LCRIEGIEFKILKPNFKNYDDYDDYDDDDDDDDDNNNNNNNNNNNKRKKKKLQIFYEYFFAFLCVSSLAFSLMSDPPTIIFRHVFFNSSS
jgi:hypothetical protein